MNDINPRSGKPYKFSAEARARMSAKKFKPIEERWAKYVNKDGPGGCWIWTGFKDPDGYGRVFYNGKLRGAHHVALEMLGTKIPAGMAVDHMCRVKACVNPDHLRIVTFTVNAKENSVSPIARNAAKTHCKRGHPFSGANLAVILVRVKKNSRGNPCNRLSRRRVCLTCYPHVARVSNRIDQEGQS